MTDEFSSQIANALMSMELGDYKTAANVLEEQIDSFMTIEKGDEGKNEYGAFLSLCGKLLESGYICPVSFYEKLCGFTSRYLGTEHPMSLSAELHLASALLITGENDKAEKNALTLLDRSEQFIGKDHPFTVQCAMILFSVYSRKHDLSSLQTLMTRVPALKRELSRPKS